MTVNGIIYIHFDDQRPWKWTHCTLERERNEVKLKFFHELESSDVTYVGSIDSSGVYTLKCPAAMGTATLAEESSKKLIGQWKEGKRTGFWEITLN